MGRMSASEPIVSPTEMDLALFDVVKRALEPYGTGAASLEHAWGDQARMWFVEVTPTNDAAAPFVAAFDGNDIVTAIVGKTNFEVYSIKQADELQYIGEIAGAVFRGQVEEVERGGCARLTLADDRVVTVGAFHLPTPWRLRRRHTYPSYGANQATS
jgi:hypothetical protein